MAPQKTKRSKKDPSAPRNPKCAYIQFIMVKRAVFVKANPKTAPKLVMKEMGKQWNAASAAERKPYVDAGEADKKRYEQEMRVYTKTPVGARVRRSRKFKDAAAPCNPMSSYCAFVKLERPKLIAKTPDLKSKEAIKQLGAMWQVATAAQKSSAVAFAAKDAARYKLEMKAYVKPAASGAAPASAAAVAPKPVKTKRKKRRRQVGGPKMPSGSYIFFVKDQHHRLKASNPGIDRKDVMRKLGAAWRVLDDAGRMKYNVQRDADKKRYGTERDAWKAQQPAAAPAAKALPPSKASRESATAAVVAVAPRAGGQRTGSRKSRRTSI